MTTEVVTHTSTIDIMAYTFACPDCSQRDQEHKYWKQRHGAKRAAIALSTVDDTDTFDEPEEDEDASREACFACEEAYEQLSTSDKEEKKQRGAQHWKTYQAIPLTTGIGCHNSRKSRSRQATTATWMSFSVATRTRRNNSALTLIEFLIFFMSYYCGGNVCNKWLTWSKV